MLTIILKTDELSQVSSRFFKSKYIRCRLLQLSLAAFIFISIELPVILSRSLQLRIILEQIKDMTSIRVENKIVTLHRRRSKRLLKQKTTLPGLNVPIWEMGDIRKTLNLSSFLDLCILLLPSHCVI